MCVVTILGHSDSTSADHLCHLSTPHQAEAFPAHTGRWTDDGSVRCQARPTSNHICRRGKETSFHPSSQEEQTISGTCCEKHTVSLAWKRDGQEA